MYYVHTTYMRMNGRVRVYVCRLRLIFASLLLQQRVGRLFNTVGKHLLLAA